MQPCFYRVWPAGVLRPAQRQLELLEELLLDRNLLEVKDATISGSKNAPRLVSLGPDRAEVNVPAANATGVLVLHDMSFARLQDGVSPREEDFRVGVVEFSVRARWVQGASFSVALLRSLRWDKPGPRDHLVPFRELSRVAPGERAAVHTPAILVVGAAAVEVLPSETRLPDSRSQALPLPRSFRLPDEGLPFDAAPKLETLVNASVPQSLFIGGHDGSVAWTELPRVGAELLKRWERHYRFLPAIVNEREPRLLLLYERGNGEVRALLSEGEIGKWLDALQTALSQTKLAAAWKNLTRREPRAALAKETTKEAHETVRPSADGRSVPPRAVSAPNVLPSTCLLLCWSWPWMPGTRANSLSSRKSHATSNARGTGQCFCALPRRTPSRPFHRLCKDNAPASFAATGGTPKTAAAYATCSESLVCCPATNARERG